MRQDFKNKNILVFGAGPSLEQNINDLVRADLFGSFLKISADGATTALIKHAIIPNYVFTDLDGSIKHIISANRQGATLVVHAHGDNMAKLKRFIPEICGKIIGSTQTQPTTLTHNLGGFTDGDRCVFWGEELGAKHIFLAGMDFGNHIGKYSKPTYRKNVVADPIKKKKLEFARHLLEWLAQKKKNYLFDISLYSPKTFGVQKITVADIPHHI